MVLNNGVQDFPSSEDFLRSLKLSQAGSFVGEVVGVPVVQFVAGTFAHGTIVGYSVGESDGTNVGALVGLNVEEADGAAEGLPVVPFGVFGLKVGVSLGFSVGLTVGTLLGPSVGTKVPLGVGPNVGVFELLASPSVGSIVGDGVGGDVGAFVGVGVGLRVGTSVGVGVGANVAEQFSFL